MVRFLVPLALVLSTSALAQTYSRPEIVRGLCQPDGCYEFAVTDAREIATDAVYFAICHGLQAGRAAVRDLPGVAQSLGYRVSLAQSKTVALNRAEDVMMAAPEGRQVQASREMLPPRDVPGVLSGRNPLDRSGEFVAVPVVPRQAPPTYVEPDVGLLAGPRRLTNQAFDTLDQIGSWLLGR